MLHARRLLRHAGELQRAGDLIGHRLGALHPPAQVQEQPAAAAHHVLRGQPGQRRRERQHARHRLERRIQRLAVAAGVDVAERILHLAQAARGDGVHLAGHLVAQQAGHARHLAEQGVDRAPTSGDAQQRLAEPGGAKSGDRLGVEQPGLGRGSRSAPPVPPSRAASAPVG